MTSENLHTSDFAKLAAAFADADKHQEPADSDAVANYQFQQAQLRADALGEALSFLTPRSLRDALLQAAMIAGDLEDIPSAPGAAAEAAKRARRRAYSLVEYLESASSVTREDIAADRGAPRQLDPRIAA
ncbi:MAG: hypothetical protein KF904_20725 [Rhodoblastus sp.]|nr:hypothetical protein [Rhodoblastus sp.]